MSEWKRHRGSLKMPKCLEGKKFEVRFRNGRTMEVRSNLDWRHYNNRHDVMAYRIIESEPAKPDYSKGFPEGTTAEDIGAKVGDEFVVVREGFGFKLEEIISLAGDDGSTIPLFENKHGDQHYMNWCELAPVPQKTAIELQAEEVGIPEPVQLVDDSQPDADGWIEWNGGKCPVPEGTLVDVRYRDGEESLGVAAGVVERSDGSSAVGTVPYRLATNWEAGAYNFTITAYRLHQPQHVASDDTSPERVEKHEEIEQVQPNKYQRAIKGVTVDVYDVLDAFGVTCQARGHAIKKLLMAGQRGHKDEAQDLREAVQAIERSIDLVKQK